MTTREKIKAEVDHLGEEHLGELCTLIERFVRSKTQEQSQQSLMQKLKHIEIEAPEDFAENLDLYLSGEKRVQ